VIPYARQTVSEADIQAVVAVLRSDFLTQGPAVPKFEQALADYCGVPHAVAMNSGTSALHVACLALGVGPGDRVWTSPNSFVASANCARYCGASVDFVDIDATTCNMSSFALAEKLARAERDGLLPKVVIPVHFAGQPCEMKSIHALAQRYGFRVIEDASHAFGSRYQDHTTGACAYSDIAVFSFHPVKIITTGEGGAAMTRDAALAARMARLRSHGITRATNELTHAPDGPWYYEQIELGFNYRITDMQAALGLSQLRSLDEWLARRHRLADCYDRELSGLPLALSVRSADTYSALHLYVVRVKDEAPMSRAELFRHLRAAGIGVNVHYIPIHLQPDYARLGFRAGDFPLSEVHYRQAISLPMYAALTDRDQDEVIRVLREALS
jgi:UDP-4-amino-4,6-dideoxy-N-acetyl-beta-L-altrosamine transaminase